MARDITFIPAKKIPRASAKNKQDEQKIHVAAYCRVSTEQEEQENSFRNQVEYYTRYISEHPDYELAGIYADEGISGTNTKKREEFKRMIADCEAHKIDMIITKSISRFARNTQDCLENYRKLKSLGVTIIFEKENINSANTTGELLLTILSSLAQDESRNISENTKWGIRSKFKKGIPHNTTSRFMGFDKDSEGRLVVNEEEAPLVRRIFREFLEGSTCNTIALRLNNEGVPGVSGEPKWRKETIENMLRNEKYKGDCLLQKFYTEDYLTKKMVKNLGQVAQYYVTDSHEAIISKEEWAAAQQELDRIEKYKVDHHLKNYGHAGEKYPFSSKIVCGYCGHVYRRKSHPACCKSVYWQCNSRYYTGKKACPGENIRDDVINFVFVQAWNSVVYGKDKLQKRWEQQKIEGNELQRLRATQMQELVELGEIQKVVPELVLSVLECIIAKGKGVFEVRFLDGTKQLVSF